MRRVLNVVLMGALVIFSPVYLCAQEEEQNEAVLEPAPAVIPAVPAPVPSGPEVHVFDKSFGTVQYKISGAETGTQMTYFDYWGFRQAHFRKVETASYGMALTVTVNIGEQTIFYDQDKRLGQKRADPEVKKLLNAYILGTSAPVAVDLLQNTGWNKIKTENFLDRSCEVWENKTVPGKVWLWNGITLKSEVKTVDGLVTMTAIKIDEATPIDPSVFAIPGEIHFMDIDIKKILISKGPGYAQSF